MPPFGPASHLAAALEIESIVRLQYTGEELRQLGRGGGRAAGPGSRSVVRWVGVAETEAEHRLPRRHIGLGAQAVSSAPAHDGCKPAYPACGGETEGGRLLMEGKATSRSS